VGVLLGSFSSGALMGILGPIRNPLGNLLGIGGFTNVCKKPSHTRCYLL
jgi:hypothetical protein